ncbi:MAG: hypothetical protein M3O15_04790 [Acidobacteriota bacterium]|nr:hypothetical protein [Acidobacteriota bacterium]
MKKKLLKLLIPVTLLCASFVGPLANMASAQTSCPQFCFFLCKQGTHCCKVNGCATCCPN